MPQRDIIHFAVRNALIKDGWTITADPYVFEFEAVRAYADLEAEPLLAAVNNGRRILVEIKAMVGPSAIHAYEEALGQYQFYRYLIHLTGTEHQVYLAVSEEAYHNILQRDGLREVVALSRMAILVINVRMEEVVQWIEPATIEP
ncbi:MAG TPA: element excision factor XisH family protein [Armatimonadota bacterium]|nr:element excision factor XisH family protein [Armatimonadota bacterium]